LVVIDEFLTVSLYQSNEFISWKTTCATYPQTFSYRTSPEKNRDATGQPRSPRKQRTKQMYV